MKVDNRQLFDLVIKVNGVRNDAIHNSLPVTRATAREGCQVVWQVLKFLDDLQQVNSLNKSELVFMTEI
jgi:hypothetical protein